MEQLLIKHGATKQDIDDASSFSYSLGEKLLLWRDEGSWTRCIAAEAAFLGVMLLGTIESLVRGVLALLVKPLDLFVTQDSLIGRVHLYLCMTCALSVLTSLISASELVTNFLPKEQEEDAKSSIFGFWGNTMDFVEPFSQLKCCGGN